MGKNLLIKSGPAIALGTSVLILYALLAGFKLAAGVVIFIFLASPFLLVYMAVCVLKDKEGLDNRTFDEYFYLDRDIPGSGADN